MTKRSGSQMLWQSFVLFLTGISLCSYIYALGAPQEPGNTPSDNNLIFADHIAALAGDRISLKIYVDNLEPFQAFEFKLHFPVEAMLFLPGFSYNYLSERAQDHVLSVTNTEPGILHVFSYSLQQREFIGQTGHVVNLGFVIGTPHPGAHYSLELSDAILVNSLGHNFLDETKNGSLVILEEISCPENKSMCLDASPMTLTGAHPSGGVYHGNGVLNGVFDPFEAGVGEHIITYKLIYEETYESTCQFQITVNPLPDVQLSELEDTCVDAPPFPLTKGFPVGGTYLGKGVTEEGYFDPQLAGVGNFTITYQFTDEKGCTGIAYSDLTVFPIPEITCPADLEVCESSDSILLSHGEFQAGAFSGPGVDDNGLFFPVGAGPGNHTITYMVSDQNGCENQCYFGVKVYPQPVVSLSEFNPLCDKSPPLLLTGGTPYGGSYSGVAVSPEGIFLPEEAGPGNFEITYEYSDEFGCTGKAISTITVYPSPKIECLNDQVFFITEDETFITAENGMLDPLNLSVSGGMIEVFNNLNGQSTLDGYEFLPGPTEIIWTATSLCGETVECSFTVYVITPSIDITIQASTDEYRIAGEEIIFSLTIENTGNATLEDLEINDSLTGFYRELEILEPGEFLEYSIQYIVNQEDVASGIIRNHARVSANCLDSVFVESHEMVELFAMLLLNISGVDLSCYQSQDGAATVTHTGGIPPHTYLWSNNETTQTITSLQAGLYGVTVTSSNGLKDSIEIMINEPHPITVSLSWSDVLCFGGNDGSATAVVIGGTEPYTYFWSNGGTSETNDQISAGDNWVMVIDKNGCEDVVVFQVDEPEELVVLFDFDPGILCLDWNHVALSGGFPEGGEYSGPGVSNGQFYPMEAGTGEHLLMYTFVDEQGCSGTAQALILVDACTLIPELSPVHHFVLYPNPAGKTLFIRFSETVPGPLIIRIYNVLGGLHKEVQVAEVDQVIMLDLGSLNSGNYILELETGQMNTRKQFIVW